MSDHGWRDSCRAFEDAAAWFVSTTRLVGDRWDRPGLGEWDVRALVGHTSRSFLTVEAYLAVPTEGIEIESPADYVRAVRPIASGPEVADRGRAAGEALGGDPVAAVVEIADRVLGLVDTCDGTEPVMTAAGGMRLADYLPTRTFELAVHTADLAVALDVPADIPPAAASQALQLVADIAIGDGAAAPLLLSATGRSVPGGFTVF